MTDRLFYFSILSFVVGVALNSIFDWGYFLGIFFIFLAVSVGGTIFFLNRDLHSKTFVLFSLMLLSLGLGFLRSAFSNEVSQDFLLTDWVEQKVTLRGWVVDEGDERENNVKLTVEIQAIKIFEETSDYSISENSFQNFEDKKIKILLTTQFYPQFDYGDEIEFSGLLQKPQNFLTENGREFDYIGYLAKEGVFYQMFYPQVKLLSQNNGNFIKEKLFYFKKSFLKKIQQVIVEPQSSLLGGLLVGAKQSLGQALQDDFRKVGLIHIVVLSGYNVTIIAEFIMGLFSFLPRLVGMSLGAVSIILFAIMVGGSATIVRASLMALLVILAKVTGRVSDLTRALFLAGLVMVLHNPQIVVFDPSFQLSFLATLGLIFFSPHLNNFFHFIPTKFYLRETLSATLSTQVFVLPLLLYLMGELSVIAILVNLLVLMFIPVTMLLGFLTGVLSFISVWLALPLAYLTYGLLTYELKVVELFASLPFSSLKIQFFPFWLMLVIYGFYFIFLKKFAKKLSKVDRENE